MKDAEEIAIRNPKMHLKFISAECKHGIYDCDGNRIDKALEC